MKTLLTSFIFAFLYSTLVFSQTELEPNRIVTTVGEYFGYINQSGEQVIPAKYKKAGFFYYGIARVMNDKNLYGFINEKGEQVVPFRFHNAQEFYALENGTTTPMKLTVVWEKQTEEYQKKTTNLSIEYYSSSSGKPKTATRSITSNGIINLKGEFIVPLSSDYQCSVQSDHALVTFTEDKIHFSVLINSDGDIVFGPVNAGIDVHPENIIVTYGNMRFVNGSYTNYGSEVYDLEGNLLVGIDKGYGLISSSRRPTFLIAHRNLYIDDKEVSKSGLIDSKGDEILHTLYERLMWDGDKELFKVFIKLQSDYDEGLFFYVDEKGNCVEIENAPCPDPPPAGFDYQAYISNVGALKPNYKKTTQVPWLTQPVVSGVPAAIETTSKEPPESMGTGPVYTDMKGVWVNATPPSANGDIFKIDNIQKDAVCGDYKKFLGNEIGIQAKLECIHADEKGYVFYLNYYERPSWSTGDKYLQVMRTEKRGNVRYKVALFNGSHDFSFSKNKLLYNKYTEITGLGRKGYTPDWWFWSVY
jgi:hypothetical protein